MPQLADFKGDWQITRLIEETGGGARAEGMARFRPDGSGALRVEESGTLTLAAGTVLRFERAYLWAQGPGGLIRTAFADGRPFHEFDPALARPQARHDCAPDTYDVAYDFSRWPDWTAVWRVTGPRKDYQMRTEYAPLVKGLQPGG